jgi:hypothetical protein
MPSKPLAALSAVLTSAICHAAEPWDAPFTLQVGAFRSDASTVVRFDADNGLPGTSIGFESNLGLSKKRTLPQLDFLWRWSPRHGLEGSYVSLRRDATAALSQAIRFGVVEFPIDGSVDSTFDSVTLRLAYRYSPVNAGGNELALLLGLHYTRVRAAISTTVSARSSEASLDFPLPTLGVRAGWRLADRWRATGMAQALKLKYGDHDGALYNLAAGIEWAFLPQAFAALGYTYYKYEYRSERHDERINFDYRFDGPALSLGWTFR